MEKKKIIIEDFIDVLIAQFICFVILKAIFILLQERISFIEDFIGVFKAQFICSVI